MRVVTFEMSNIFVLSPSNSKATVKERNRRLRKNRLLEFITRPYYSGTQSSSRRTDVYADASVELAASVMGPPAKSERYG